MNKELKQVWFEKYSKVPETLKNVKTVKKAATAFNANVDAVLKIKPAKILKLVEQEDMSLANIRDIRESKLKSGADVIKAVMRCFERGIAEEWLTEDVKVYDWMVANLGYDRLQMGGQGGIVSNALAMVGVQKVFVHTNSLPKLQAEQFLKRNNLVSFDEHGKVAPAYKIDRALDLPLIHWIIEFDKGDKIEIEGVEIVCPKSNRFIATYDPLNLNLVMDENFVKSMTKKKMDYIVLSGFHALSSDMNGVDIVDDAVPVVEKWKKDNTIMHLELASTQDIKVRKAIVEKVAPMAESLGANEREVIDVLEVMGEKELAQSIDEDTHSVSLFKGLYKMKQKIKSPRIQLHMFGLYIVIQDKGFRISPEANLRGMAMAATAAASKAGTGAVVKPKDVLWAHGREVSDVGLKEIMSLAEFFGDDDFAKNGIFEYKGYDVIAVPTILIDKPVTLVGMGDTISSMSLISAR